DGATFLKAQQPGNPESEYRVDDADDDGGNQPHLLAGLHDDAGQPADNTADDQRHSPTHGPTSRCDEMYWPVKQQIRQSACEGLPILVNSMGRQSEKVQSSTYSKSTSRTATPPRNTLTPGSGPARSSSAPRALAVPSCTARSATRAP